MPVLETARLVCGPLALTLTAPPRLLRYIREHLPAAALDVRTPLYEGLITARVDPPSLSEVLGRLRALPASLGELLPHGPTYRVWRRNGNTLRLLAPDTRRTPPHLITVTTKTGRAAIAVTSYEPTTLFDVVVRLVGELVRVAALHHGGVIWDAPAVAMDDQALILLSDQPAAARIVALQLVVRHGARPLSAGPILLVPTQTRGSGQWAAVGLPDGSTHGAVRRHGSEVGNQLLFTADLPALFGELADPTPLGRFVVLRHVPGASSLLSRDVGPAALPLTGQAEVAERARNWLGPAALPPAGGSVRLSQAARSTAVDLGIWSTLGGLHELARDLAQGRAAGPLAALTAGRPRQTWGCTDSAGGAGGARA